MRFDFFFKKKSRGLALLLDDRMIFKICHMGNIASHHNNSDKASQTKVIKPQQERRSFSCLSLRVCELFFV